MQYMYDTEKISFNKLEAFTEIPNTLHIHVHYRVKLSMKKEMMLNFDAVIIVARTCNPFVMYVCWQ